MKIFLPLIGAPGFTCDIISSASRIFCQQQHLLAAAVQVQAEQTEERGSHINSLPQNTTDRFGSLNRVRFMSVRDLLIGIVVLISSVVAGCVSAEKPGPVRVPDASILESSDSMRIYRVDYDTTFRAAVDALRLIDNSSAKLVRYDAGLIVFNKPNNIGHLIAKVKRINEQETQVVMSAKNRRRLWFDGTDIEKRDAFFAEIDKLLGSGLPEEADAGENEVGPLPPRMTMERSDEEPERSKLLAALKERLQLGDDKSFLDNLSYEDLTLLDQKLKSFCSACVHDESGARRCAGCYIDLARLHHNNRQYPRSAEALKIAIKIDPDNALAHCNLGEIYKHLGLVDDAIMELNKAKSLNPGLPDVYINLGIMYDDYIGDDAKALEHYKKYLELGGSDKQVLGWIRTIEEGS